MVPHGASGTAGCDATPLGWACSLALDSVCQNQLVSASMTRVQSNVSSDHTRARIVVAFDWLLRPWKFLETPHGTTAYMSAAGCFCGAILFLIAVCAACVPAVSACFICAGPTASQVRGRSVTCVCTSRCLRTSKLVMAYSLRTTGWFCFVPCWAASFLGWAVLHPSSLATTLITLSSWRPGRLKESLVTHPG